MENLEVFRQYSTFLKDIATEEEEELMLVAMAINMIKRLKRKKKRGGSRRGKRRNVNRDHQAGYQRLMNDYFGENPTYSNALFERRFRMSKEVFGRVLDGVTECDVYFRTRKDATGKPGISGLQKILGALRMLAYGVSSDMLDDCLRMSESTIAESFEHFCTAVISKFGDEYLRAPTNEDIERLLTVADNRGWPGMIGCIDCMHWMWDMCPVAWQGQFKGKDKKASVVLEAVASYDLWIWHANFGIPGSNNDINIIDSSPIIAELMNSSFCYEYNVNGKKFNQLYFLADGIYPEWSCFVKTISHPQTNKKKHFAKKQEGTRKDVERAFGVIQKQFSIVRSFSRLWTVAKMKSVMMCCIILHNMIVESRRDDPSHYRSLLNNDSSPVNSFNTAGTPAVQESVCRVH
jgi:Plant transposon protein